jgi:hypothetical protein
MSRGFFAECKKTPFQPGLESRLKRRLCRLISAIIVSFPANVKRDFAEAEDYEDHREETGNQGGKSGLEIRTGNRKKSESVPEKKFLTEPVNRL